MVVLLLGGIEICRSKFSGQISREMNFAVIQNCVRVAGLLGLKWEGIYFLK